MKKKKLLKKYQFGNTNTNFGGGSSAFSTPKLKTWNPSYTLGATGDIKFNTPQIKPLKVNTLSSYGIQGKGGSSFTESGGGGGISQGAMAGITAGIGALQEWSKFPQQVREGQALIADINEAKYKRKKSNVEQAERNVENMHNRYGYTNLYGYGYPAMKYGGSLPKYELGSTSGMYGSSMYRNTSDDYNSQLANMNPSDVTQQYATGITESHMNTAVSSIPGFGQVAAALIPVSQAIREGAGEQQVKYKKKAGLFGYEEDVLDDAYFAEGDSDAIAAGKGAMGNLTKPTWEHAAESWGKAAAAEDTGDKVKYAFEGIGDILGITTIAKQFQGGVNSANAAREARVAAALKDDKSMAGGTAGFGGSGTTRIGGNIVGSDKAQIKQGEMGGYLEKYKGGGYHMPSYRQGTQLGIAQEVPRDMANAEVEGGGIKRMKKGGAIKEKGETIYNAMNGTMDIVMGAKHASDNAAVQKGVPVVLKEGSPAEGGDLVFSDVAMIKDPATGKKAPASDLSIKYKDNPEILSYIAAEQSRIAQIKNSKKKNGGMLKQYQQGTYSEFDKMLALDSLQKELREDSYSLKDTTSLSEFDKMLLNDASIKSNPLMHPQLRSWNSKIHTYNIEEKQRIQDEMNKLRKKDFNPQFNERGSLKKYQQGTSEFDKMLILDSLQQELRTDSYNPKDTATLSEFDKKILDDAAIKSNPLMHPQLRSWKSKIGTYNLAEKQRIQDEMLELKKAVNSINIENDDSFQKNLIEKSTKEKLGRAGTLKKYQQGTPTLTQAEIDALNALQGSGAPPNFMQRQQAAQQAAQTSQAPATYQAAAAQAQQQVAAQIAQSKAQTASQSFAARSANIPIGTPPVAPTPTSPSAYTKQRAKLASGQAAALQAAKKKANAAYTQAQYKAQGLNAAGQPYNFSGLNITQPKGKKGKKAQAAAAAANAAVASTKSGTPTIDDFYDDKGKLFGEKSGWQKAMDSGIIDIGLGVAGAGAQVLGAALKPNLYKNLKGPSFNPVTWEKQFFDRADYRDQYTAADRAFARGQQTILASGAGPNTSANIQALENQRVSAYENIMGREMDFNMRQDAAEKQLNAEGALRVNLANQESKFNTESAQTGINTLAAQMEMARTDALVGAGVGFANDARKTLSDMRYANAILGDGPNMNNKMDVEAAMKQLKAKYPKQAGETEAEYSSRLGQYQNMIQAQLNS